MEDDDDDKNLLGSLGVTTVDSEAIEHEILSQVKNCVSGVSGQSCEELENDRDHKVLDPSSSNFAKLYQKLRAIEVEIRAVGSSIPEEKNEETGDDLNYRFEPGQFSTVGSSLHQELAKDRIRSLQRTKAQLQKEISQFKEQDSTGGFELGNLVDNLVKEGPNHKQKNKKVEKSNQNPKQHRKRVTYQEDLYFDAVLDAGSAGFVETEREELIRKGILTPFHKIKGFERRLQLPSTSKHHEHVEDSNDNLASSSIARVAQSLADIACHRPSTKLLDAKHLPIPDPPTRPFQRLRKPQKIPPTTEKKRKKGQNSRPSSHKKWRKVGIQKEEVPDGSDGVGNGSDYCEEKQNNSDSSNDEEQLCVVLEGGLKIPNSIFSNLFDYQKVGLQWLWELHCQKAGE
ncbi:hypothetical protein HPP92_009780 [Vanilla planifolia]|uniref:Uncharacterized protein n=1 Tax=Vanilla planifolia TaxID=51239 RepID=A0A835RAQ7_VANPL|nr:hypothetical protein HPP92_009780 [Vanilla planifolia]